MAAPRLAAALADADSVPVRRFERYDVAIEAMAVYETALGERASLRRSRGLPVTDQDQPEEAFCLVPVKPRRPPLAIVGGMGPLAGASAFRRACARFQNSRTVVLYQACSMPDRSTVILSQGSIHAASCRSLAARLTGAVRWSAGLASPAGDPVRCLLACNSAHYLWRRLEDQLRPDNLQMVSLVKSSLEAIRFQSCQRVLLLATEGARVGRVFSTPFHDAGIIFEEPSPTLSRLLMRAIFEGVKSLDRGRALEFGNQFFESILEAGRDCDSILAGCTEIPLLIYFLRTLGSRRVASFLNCVRVIDPLEEALCRA
jgi:aspartate racemase